MTTDLTPFAAPDDGTPAAPGRSARRRRRGRRPDQDGVDQRMAVNEAMPAPAPRAQPQQREVVRCAFALHSHAHVEPYRQRPELATLRDVEVDRLGEAVLVCDRLHDRPHAWPEAYAPMVPQLFALVSDRPDDAVEAPLETSSVLLRDDGEDKDLVDRTLPASEK